jgi:peroxiredoxin
MRMPPHVRKYWLLGSVAVAALTLLIIADYLSRRPLPSPRDALGEQYAAPAGAGSELIGAAAGEWTTAPDWINSEPLTLGSLRGKVVLVRWWTAPGCRYCEATAPALVDFWQRYRERGLVLIGMYHHKSDTPLTRDHVERQARRFGFGFPVAIDEDWRTLRRWWLNHGEQRWTSVTFLIDRAGLVRHIHPGGAFFKTEPGYVGMEYMIERLLQE